MSIPSVSFNKRSAGEVGASKGSGARRTRRRANDQPYIGNENPMMNINLSSSSDSDDVPVISTKTTNSNPILVDFDSESSSSTTDEMPGGINGNWGAASAQPPIRIVTPSEPLNEGQIKRKRRPSKSQRGRDNDNDNDHSGRVRRRRKTNDNVSDDENQNEEEQRHERRKVIKRVRKVRRPVAVEEESSDSDHNQREEEEEEKEEVEEVKVVKRRRKSRAGEPSPKRKAHQQDDSKNDTDSSETKSGYIPDPIPEGVSNYTMIRTKKTFGSASFHMVADEKCIFACEPSEDKISKLYNITRKFPAKRDSPSYQGFLRVHEHGHRFTLVSNFEKPNDDRDGELLGVCFTKTPAGRKMRIAMTHNIVPFFPISKRLNLSRVAKEEKEMQKFDYLEVVKSPDDDFGSDIAVKSVKNFKLTNQKTGQLIFQIYKYADGQYNIKSAYPLNPFLAFGLAVACILSEK